MIVIIIVILMRLQNQLNNMSWDSVLTVFRPIQYLL